jgi:hypothetical protein
VPDVVDRIRDHLLTVAAVTTQVGTRIYGFDLPTSPTYPAVRLIRVGGPADFEGHIDEALVQVDVFGSTRENAYDAHAPVRAALAAMGGLFGTDVISKVVEVTGPGWLPDPTTERPRWTWDVRVYAHA